ncbi:MAG: class III signal peptide-containing protein [Methanobacterium sp. ERen5]|nr:MAG: class III signal peptide-containing protein [Methanobacterium sp. ERen5]
MLMDEHAQISAEMILIMGVLLVIVIVAGGFITSMAQQISNSVGNVLNTARDGTINRM